MKTLLSRECPNLYKNKTLAPFSSLVQHTYVGRYGKVQITILSGVIYDGIGIYYTWGLRLENICPDF